MIFRKKNSARGVLSWGVAVIATECNLSDIANAWLGKCMGTGLLMFLFCLLEFEVVKSCRELT